MKLFNLDCHISVIADIKKILEDLGHEVISLSISGHNWVFNRNSDNVEIVNQHTWNNLSEEMCDEFYKRYKNELDKYDAFITTHTPSFSLLYEKFKKPIIAVSSTRYEQPFSLNKEKWNWFNNYYENNNYIIPIANNLYDKFYTESFVDRKLDYIPSYCEYTNMNYTETYDKKLVHYKGNINLSKDFVNKNSLGRYTWDDISKYKYIFILPYNTSVMSYFEYYTANIPLVFPSKEFLLKLYGNYGILSELSFMQVFGKENKSTIDYKTNLDPNNYLDINLIKKAIDLSDFYNEYMPYITYINDISELENLNIDYIDISNKMKKFNINKKIIIQNMWDSLLKNLK